jgi:glutamate mutase epsilon subunit|tara:strand:- start:265 stop:534 length:270 start_codon:yes stop_codon:yes gene_type:complete
MAKKRRKLNKDFEKKIYSEKKNVELVLAKIFDIDDEDIQKEYMTAFNEVVYLYDVLKEAYDQSGFNEDSEGLLKNYKNSYNLFESEYEI